MTAATASIGRPSARARVARHWERTLVVLGIVLPVPLLAVTGLSIPLPATVERIAAALVPWTETSSVVANEALSQGRSGVIVRTPDEAREAVPVPVAAGNPRSQASANPFSDQGTRADSNGTAGHDGGNASGGSGSGGGSGGGGGGGGGGSGTTTPVEGVVDTVGGTVGGVVDDPSGTVDDVTGTVDDVVGSTGLSETVDGILPGPGK